MTALAVMAGTLQGCVPEAPAPVLAAGPQLGDAISGHSFVGTMPDGSSVCVYHAADGRFIGRSGGLVSGRWTVEDDRLCYAYVQGPDQSDCRQAVLRDDRIAFLFAELVIGQGRLAEGNVCA
ncbi:MAG: hypothetical protein ACFCVH_15570 [Alphaproteobacteria bacterium]